MSGPVAFESLCAGQSLPITMVCVLNGEGNCVYVESLEEKNHRTPELERTWDSVL